VGMVLLDLGDGECYTVELEVGTPGRNITIERGG
jgi:hypothetical protein